MAQDAIQGIFGMDAERPRADGLSCSGPNRTQSVGAFFLDWRYGGLAVLVLFWIALPVLAVLLAGTGGLVRLTALGSAITGVLSCNAWERAHKRRLWERLRGPGNRSGRLSDQAGKCKAILEQALKGHSDAESKIETQNP